MKISNQRTAKKAQIKAGSVPIFKKRWWLLSAIAAVILLTVLGGVYYYQSHISPFRQPVLTVDNTVILMDYFLKRTKITNGDPAAILEQLAYEQIVKIEAPEYGIEVSKSDVDEELRSMAAIASKNTVENATRETTTEMAGSSFREWYSQQLATTGLSDAEYKEIIRTNLLGTHLREYLASTIPARVEQIHLNVMALATYRDAEKAKARITAGETFADVAREVSVDAMSKANGGDLGWIPRGVIPYDDVVFQIEVGQVSDPVMVDSSNPTTSQYALFLISEKDANREIEAYLMPVLSSRAFYNWLMQEIPQHVIKYNYSAETQVWVGRQLTKALKK